ncbi:MAG: type II methionyl aminopeptidase [Candidatus Aenigmarchaeota archaeon]|nr:type II methionyl aminopeptidase [Candidatus Aenigmarchaeota archaeon]
MMDGEVFAKYREAGRINAEIKAELMRKARPGMGIMDLAELVDGMIEQAGAKPAFPVNISINEIAAHYTPTPNDGIEIKDGDMVKFDVGVQVDGYIADSAFTYCSQKNELVETVNKAITRGIAAVKPGAQVRDVAGAIEGVVKDAGLGLIVNLTGHYVDRYMFHAPPSIPNVKNQVSHEFREGDALAIEPFVTPTNGFAKETSITEIYRYLQDRPVRLPEARLALAMARDDFSQLPFAKRWLLKKFSPVKVSMALRQLESVGAIETYPALRESSSKLVAQAEHTLVVTGTGHFVTTEVGD